MTQITDLPDDCLDRILTFYAAGTDGMGAIARFSMVCKTFDEVAEATDLAGLFAATKTNPCRSLVARSEDACDKILSRLERRVPLTSRLAYYLAAMNWIPEMDELVVRSPTVRRYAANLIRQTPTFDIVLIVALHSHLPPRLIRPHTLRQIRAGYGDTLPLKILGCINAIAQSEGVRLRWLWWLHDLLRRHIPETPPDIWSSIACYICLLIDGASLLKTIPRHYFVTSRMLLAALHGGDAETISHVVGGIHFMHRIWLYPLGHPARVEFESMLLERRTFDGGSGPSRHTYSTAAKEAILRLFPNLRGQIEES